MIRRLLMTAAIIGLAATARVFAEDDAATTAVNAAKQYSGTSITVVAEAGLHALLDTQYTGPEREKRLGIKGQVVELRKEEIYPKTVL